MHNITKNPLKDRIGVLDVLKLWIVLAILIISTGVSSMVMMEGIAAPVITDEYWEDTFNDTTGIETWDNLELVSGDIKLIKGVTFYEDFTGNNGDPPNPLIWDIIDDGYTLEIENNQLKASIGIDVGAWNFELVQTNKSFPANHVLTWTQQFHLIGDGNGMFYHFYILNASNGSRIFGVNQNHLNEYHAVNYPADTSTVIDSSLNGWYDFKVIFMDGFLEYYVNDVKKYEDYFDVQWVKYEFGTGALAEVSTIITDNITLTSYLPSGNITSTKIDLPPDKSWNLVSINKSQTHGNEIRITVIDGITFQPIAGFENLIQGDIDISTIDESTHPSIRLRAHFLSDGGNTSLLHDWKVTYSDIIPPDTPTGLEVTNPFTGYSRMNPTGRP